MQKITYFLIIFTLSLPCWADNFIDQFQESTPQIVLADGEAMPNTVRLIVEQKDNLYRYYLENRSNRPVSVKEVVIGDVAHSFPGDSLFYGEGFTMLSQNLGTLSNIIDADGLTDRGHYKLAEPEGYRTVYGMMYVIPPSGDAMVLGFNSCRRFVGKFHVNDERIQIVIPTENLILHPAQRWELEELSILTGPDRNALLKDLASRINENHPRLPWPELPTGWCSWYCFGPRVTNQNIADNLRVFSENLPAARYIQIDDGYQPWMGDWLESNAQFEGGVQKSIDNIRKAGFEPAIWVAPFIASPTSALFQNHPDWFIKDEDGNPLRSDQKTFGGWRQKHWHMLDGTHPGAQDYLEHVFRTMREEWGCAYFKLDANAWGAFPFGKRHDPTASSVEAYRRGMAAVRRGSGGAFLLGCNHAMWPSLGEVHGSRSSMDIGRSWNSFTRITRENLLRNWQNNRLWWNDPDCLLITGNLPENEKSFHMAATFATGGMVLSGDDATQYDESQWRIMKKAAENPGVAANFSGHDFSEGTISIAGKTHVVFLNWNDNPEPRAAHFSGAMRVRDYWTDEDLGVHAGSFETAEMPGRSGRVFVLEPVE